MAEILPFDRTRRMKHRENGSQGETKQAYLLHLDLFFGEENEDDPWEREVLQKYGHVKRGITRDVLVPSDMNLTALHYVLLHCFGWRDSHLHDFTLPDDVFQKLTGGIETPDAMGQVVYDGPFRRWADLCGVYFRFPVDDSEDERWMDAYDERMKFETWLRRHYTGPYRYVGEQEHYAFANTSIHEIMERFPMVRENIPFHEWVKLEESGRLEEEQEKRVIPVNQARIQDLNPYFEQHLTDLLERLSVAELLVPEQREQNPDAALRNVNTLPAAAGATGR